MTRPTQTSHVEYGFAVRCHTLFTPLLLDAEMVNMLLNMQHKRLIIKSGTCVSIHFLPIFKKKKKKALCKKTMYKESAFKK